MLELELPFDAFRSIVMGRLRRDRSRCDYTLPGKCIDPMENLQAA